MGLDIYLYTAIDAAQNKLHDEASDAYYEREDFDSLSEGDKKAIRDAMPPYVPHQDVPSERYPDHLFNRRYLRSSYNSGGFNHAVPQLLATSGVKEYPHERGSLYWIFEPMGREWDGDEGTLTHDDLDKLRACKARALEVVADLKKSDRLRVTTVSPNTFLAPPATTDDEALQMYRNRTRDKFDQEGSWYSTRDMAVFGKGMTLLAAIPGRATLGELGVHLIYKPDADEGFDFYVQSAEIVAEFCDEAIMLIQRDGGASMVWSG